MIAFDPGATYQVRGGHCGGATYADGIGPSIDHLLEWSAPGAAPRLKPPATFARNNHLLIHPFTLRIDDLPKNAPSPTAVLNALTKLAKIDGLFSDFPDLVVRYRASH
ncbi:MAG: hypothetical protein NVS9B2_25960 [Steroidobacteraceae bacterium]